MDQLKKCSPYLYALIVLITVNLIFFRYQLGGSKMNPPDEVSHLGVAEAIYKHQNQTRETTYWTNSLYGGMPTYQINKLNLGKHPLKVLHSALGLFTPPVLSYFISMSLLAFLSFLMLRVGVRWACLGAILYTYTVGHITVASVGHYTKLDSLVFMPIILAGTYHLIKGHKMMGLLATTFGLVYHLAANHLQMTFYLFLILFIYFIVEGYQAYILKQIKPYISSVLLFTAALVLAVMANFAQLYATYDYAEDTVRGKRIITPISGESKATGLDWKYSTQASAGLLDILAMVIPGIAGGSSAEKISQGSPLVQEYKRARKAVPEDFLVNLYWGKIPVTSGPDYVGILGLILFVLSCYYISGAYKIWALTSLVLLILISLGNGFFLNKILFDYFPLFNKFRSPNSALLVAASLIPWFGIIGWQSLVDQKWTRERLNELLKKRLLPLAGGILLILLFGVLFFDFRRAGDEGVSANLNLLVQTRKDLFIRDAIKSLFLVIAFGLCLFYFLQHRVKSVVFFLIVGLLIMFDFLPLADKYMGDHRYKEQKEISKSRDKRPADRQILADQGLHYRVYDKSGATFVDAKASTFHKSLGGYHPAKLRRFQDLIDGYFLKDNQLLVNMFNVKYIINEENRVIRNPEAFGNAWFTDSLIRVHTPDEEFGELKNLYRKGQTIFLEDEFPDYWKQDSFNNEGSIVLDQYKPNYLKYKYNSPAEQLVIFSEIWYGPNKGWKAFVDGQQAEHIRVNYALRALKVGPGTHSIEFRFVPDKILAAIQFNKVFNWILFLLGMIIAGMLIKPHISLFRQA